MKEFASPLTSTWSPLTLLAHLGLFCAILLPVAAKAQDVEAWREELAKLEEVIKARVQSDAEKAVKRRDVAVKIRLGWPVNEPSLTKEEVKEAVEKKIAEDVERKYPKSDLDRFRTEAEEKFRVYEKGEEVSFVIRGGKGPNTFVKGKLREVQPVAVLISNPSRRIARTDMKEDDLARFYPEVSEEYVKRYVRVQSGRRTIGIEDYTKELQKKYFAPAYRAAGYVPRMKKYARSINPDAWVSPVKVLDHFHAKAVEAKKKEIHKQVREEMLLANDYVYNEKVAEWVPKKVNQSLADKLKGLIGKKDKKDEGEEDWEDDWEEEGEDDAKDKAKAKDKAEVEGGDDAKAKESAKEEAPPEPQPKGKEKGAKKGGEDALFDEEQ